MAGGSGATSQAGELRGFNLQSASMFAPFLNDIIRLLHVVELVQMWNHIGAV